MHVFRWREEFLGSLFWMILPQKDPAKNRNEFDVNLTDTFWAKFCQNVIVFVWTLTVYF